jgi:5-methylcytosine-specific restriction endonuclease McrA
MAKRNIRRSLDQRTKELMKSVFENTCAICGKVSDHTEIDHIIPLWNGGTDEVDNLQVVCYECHKKKSADEHRELAKLHPQLIWTYENDKLVSVREAKHGAR